MIRARVVSLLMNLPLNLPLALPLAAFVACNGNPRTEQGREGTGQTGHQSTDKGPTTLDEVPTVTAPAGRATIVDPTIAPTGAPSDAGVPDAVIGDGGPRDGALNDGVMRDGGAVPPGAGSAVAPARR